MLQATLEFTKRKNTINIFIQMSYIIKFVWERKVRNKNSTNIKQLYHTVI